MVGAWKQWALWIVTHGLVVGCPLLVQRWFMVWICTSHNFTFAFTSLSRYNFLFCLQKSYFSAQLQVKEHIISVWLHCISAFVIYFSIPDPFITFEYPHYI